MGFENQTRAQKIKSAKKALANPKTPRQFRKSLKARIKALQEGKN